MGQSEGLSLVARIGRIAIIKDRQIANPRSQRLQGRLYRRRYSVFMLSRSAFLNPKDVRKYGEFYEECSKKKMRGLSPAIVAADELYKKRVESAPKNSKECLTQRVLPKKAKERTAASLSS